MSPSEARDRELRAVRWVPAPPSRVWTACTTKRGLEAWWSPEDLRTSVRRLEVRTGGSVVIDLRYAPALLLPGTSESFRAAGVPIRLTLRGILREVVEERLLLFDLNLDLDRAGAGVGLRTRLEIAPEGSGTRVTIVGTGSDTPHWARFGERNLEAQLERLDRHLAGSRAASPAP